jgi:magnesium transporter
MLHVYRDTGSFLTSPSTDLPGEIIWMDVVNPTEEEKGFVQARAHARIPTKEALSEIETSGA